MAVYLRTDEHEEAISAVEMVAESLEKAKSNWYQWKWALLALHRAVQGFMVLALRGTNSLAVLKADDAKAWVKAFEEGDPLPLVSLDEYLNLYKKVKGDAMLQYVISRRFVPKGTQGGSIKMLNRLRNQFIHFVPKNWSLEVSGLPTLFWDCLDFIEFLGWECGNVLWYDKILEGRARDAIASARADIVGIGQLYGVVIPVKPSQN